MNIKYSLFKPFSQLAIAGLVLKCFGSSKSAVRIGTSVAIIYCGLYLFERTVWALNGKEKQIKMAALAFATERYGILDFVEKREKKIGLIIFY